MARSEERVQLQARGATEVKALWQQFVYGIALGIGFAAGTVIFNHVVNYL